MGSAWYVFLAHDPDAPVAPWSPRDLHAWPREDEPRFVRVDEGFQITDVSPQFFVAERGQDVATGLARQGDRLIAGFTSGGTRGLLATMGVEAVVAALLPVDAPGRRQKARTSPSTS